MPATPQAASRRRAAEIQGGSEARLCTVRTNGEAGANRLTFHQQACHATSLEKRSAHASACVQRNARSFRCNLRECGVQFAPPDPASQPCCSALQKTPLGHASSTVVSNAAKFRAEPGRVDSWP